MFLNIEKTTDTISDETWQEWEEICHFLEPFAIVSKEMCGSKYPTLAGVIPYFNALCDHIEETMEKYDEKEVCICICLLMFINQ